VQGFHSAFLVAGGIAVAGAVMALLTIDPTIGRVERVPEPTHVPRPAEALPAALLTARPARALASCAQYSPVARHAAIVEAASEPGGP
jgi:hypothetical protein